MSLPVTLKYSGHIITGFCGDGSSGLQNAKNSFACSFKYNRHIITKFCGEGPRAQVSVTSTTPNRLTHSGRVTHICVGKLTIIGSDNGLSPERHQATI